MVVAERGIEVKRKGRVVVGRCPFHEEKTASFTITPGRGLFHCFGCGAAGDVIGFVTKYDKVSFGGALEVLARRAGLNLAQLMAERPRLVQRTPLAALTPPPGYEERAEGAPPRGAPPAALLSRVVEHYHRTW
jgi:DNA primase